MINHPRPWFVPPFGKNPTITFPPLKPFKPNHKPGSIPAYLIKQKNKLTTS